MSALHLAIEVRRSRAYGSELDAPLQESVLHFVGSELRTSVGLDTLHREGHLVDHTLQEQQGVGSSPLGVEADHLLPRATVNSRVLVETRCDLAGIHLYPLTRCGFLVSLRLLHPSDMA